MSYQPKIIKPPPELDGEDDFVPPSAEMLKELTARKNHPAMDSPGRPPIPKQGSVSGSTGQQQIPQPGSLISNPATTTTKPQAGAANQTTPGTKVLGSFLSGTTSKNRFGLVVLTVLAVIGNFIAVQLTTYVGLSFIWSSLVAGGLIALFYRQRKYDAETAKWQANMDLLQSRTSRVLSSPNETAEWLNSIIRSAWSATLPGLQPRAVEAFNSVIASLPLSLPLKSIRCIDVDLSDAVPTVVQVSSIFADSVAGQFPKSRSSSAANGAMPMVSDMMTNKPPQFATTTTNNMLGTQQNVSTNNASWLSIFGSGRNANYSQYPFVSAVRQMHPPAIALDADLVVNTTYSQAVFISKLAYLPIEVTVILHAIRIQATVRIFAEFNHSLPFPHISRLSTTFLEPPELRFDLKTSQQVNLNQLPFISASLHTHIIKFIMRNAMHPDWFDVFVNPVCNVSPLQHHIQHPSQNMDDILATDPEQFRAAIGVLIIDARLIPRVQAPTVANTQLQQQINNYNTQQQQQLALQQQQQQQASGDCWLIFQLAGRRRYEQIDVARNSKQISTGKFAFLVCNAESENLRIEAWTKRGNLPVKVRQIVVRSTELFKIPNIASTSPFTGPNRVELPLAQWDSSIHLVTNYVHLTAVPLFSLMPPGPGSELDQGKAQLQGELDVILGGDRSSSAFTTIYQRRQQAKQVSGMMRSEDSPGPGPGQRTSSISAGANQITLGGVLFVRFRNLNIRPVETPSNETIAPGIVHHQRFVYAVVTLNGEMIACSAQHPRGREGEAITAASVHELEVIVPPPANQQQNQELEFSIDIMLNDSPIKALHTLLGSATFNYRLPGQKIETNNQNVSLNATSKNLLLPISRSLRKTKLFENEHQGKASEAGHLNVDVFFRPVGGLEDINPPIRVISQTAQANEAAARAFRRQTSQDFLEPQQNVAANEFYEITLIGATDLRLPNPNSLGDLFMKVKLNDRAIYSTRVKPSTLEPVWNEKFRLPNLTEWDRVLLEVWDHDFVSKNHYVGHVTLSGDQVLANSIPGQGVAGNTLQVPTPQQQQQQQMMQAQQTRMGTMSPPPNSFEPIMPASQLQQQQQQQCSIWLPLAEGNGQVEVLIVTLQSMQQHTMLGQQQQQPQLRRYSGSQSSVSYYRSPSQSISQHTTAATSPLSPISSPVLSDLHLNSPFPTTVTTSGGDLLDRANSNANAIENLRRNSFNRAATCISPVLQRQTAVSFGSTEGLSVSGMQDVALNRPSSAAPAVATYHSFSMDTLNGPPNTGSVTTNMNALQGQGYLQQQMSMYDESFAAAMAAEQNKVPMLEAALLASSSAANVRVSLIVCLLEVRGNLSTLLRSSGPAGLARYNQSQHYISIKISKKNTAKTFQVFSTTLAKSRPLPVQEPLFDNSVVPTVIANMTFQLLDMRLDGVVKIVVTPLELSSAAAANVSSTSRPMLGGAPASSPSSPVPSTQSEQLTPMSPKSYANQLASAKPISPVIDWTCDVRELLAGGAQEFDPVVMQGNQQAMGGRTTVLPNIGISRRVRFYVCPPDINFVFRVTQIFRPQQMSAKPSTSSVSAAVNARRYSSLRQPPSQRPPPQTVVIPPNQQQM